MTLAIEASQLREELEAACRIEATVSEDETEELWIIPTCSRGRQVTLYKKNPKTDNYFSCLPLQYIALDQDLDHPSEVKFLVVSTSKYG